MKRVLCFLFGPIGYFIILFVVNVKLNLFSDLLKHFGDKWFLDKYGYLVWWSIWYFIAFICGLLLFNSCFGKKEDLPNPLMKLIPMVFLYFIPIWTYDCGFHKLFGGVDAFLLIPLIFATLFLPLWYFIIGEKSSDSSSSYEPPIKTSYLTYKDTHGNKTERTTRFYSNGNKEIEDNRIN